MKVNIHQRNKKYKRNTSNHKTRPQCRRILSAVWIIDCRSLSIIQQWKVSEPWYWQESSHSPGYFLGEMKWINMVTHVYASCAFVWFCYFECFVILLFSREHISESASRLFLVKKINRWFTMSCQFLSKYFHRFSSFET